jgi:FkbM family methyltransferase
MAIKDHILDFIINKLSSIRTKKTSKTPSFFSPEQLQLFDKKGTYLHKVNSKTNLYLHNDSVLSKAIMDGFEENELNFLHKYIKEDDIFMDIGANIGLFSVTASEKITSGQIFAFEPSPKTFERLVGNINLNNSQGNILPQNIALSDKPDSLDFYLSLDGFDAWNGFTLPQVGSYFQRIKVKTITLDQFFTENKLNKINLIKIDVEGWEYPVLKGSTEIIKKFSPDFLIEFTEENARTSGFQCIMIFDLLLDLDYQWYEIDLDLSYNQATRKEYFEYCNLLATKNIDLVKARTVDWKK